MGRITIIILVLVGMLWSAGNEEFRATWVITWNHSSSSDDPEASKARIRQILDNHKKANMNAVLWQVRQGGTAYYNSSYEPWGSYSNGPYPGGYDPFAYAVQEAHKRGLEIHAWFNVFSASSTRDGAPAAEHPEWVCRDGFDQPMPKSRALSPGLKDVRDYTVQVAMEIVRNYDIDGLHLDYVRWNEYYRSQLTGSQTEQLRPEDMLDGFISEEDARTLATIATPQRYLYDVEHPYSDGIPAGFDSWEDWWRWSVTEFVRTLHDSIKAVKPWVRLSPAALGKYRWSNWQGYGTVYQDAALWFNEGYVDQLTPMHYHWTTGDDFYGMLQANGSESWGHWIQPGIDAGRLFTVGPGSYVLAENNIFYKHKEIVERSRDVPWTDGFQFFSYGTWQDYRYWETAAESFFPNRTKIRAAKYLADLTPSSPALTLIKLDSLNYNITINPGSRPDENQWFAVYRSPDEILDPAEDEIIHVHFGKDSFIVNETFSGLQDFNGSYTYYATMLDRYWNESPMSNVRISDAIPSFAPVIISTYPAAVDTLPVTSSLIVHFSKHMDPSSIEGQITIEPQVEIGSLVWSDNNSTLEIVPATTFRFGTTYTLTISAQVSDVNGKQLDGNGDGGGSEPFVLTFRTMDVDTAPPQIFYSNLKSDFLTDGVDVEDVLTIAFDELLDNSTIDEYSMGLFRGQQEVPLKYLLNTISNKSVLSVQPDEPFGSYVEYALELYDQIADTTGNHLDSTQVLNFRTEAKKYSKKKMVDEFREGTGSWWDPDGSGSTAGTIPNKTTFGYNRSFYLPAASRPLDRYSAKLHFEWDPDAPTRFIREHCAGGAAYEVTFDTSYTLQCYIYGDGSHNKIRFSIRENNGQGTYPYEVSQWHTIDWTGWKLLEWDLSDPASVGSWLGNEVLDGSSYQIESFQISHQSGAAMAGDIYLKNLRVVQKTDHVTSLSRDLLSQIPGEYRLSQNYPNPFNPVTTIEFFIPENGLTTLSVYNVLGQKIRMLVNRELSAGQYKVAFDGSNLASGLYIYELRSGKFLERKRMMLVK